MKPPGFELIQPHSLEEACSILGGHDGKAAVLAGGTALVVAFRYRLSKSAVYPGSRSHGLWPWMNAPNFGRDVAPLGR